MLITCPSCKKTFDTSKHKGQFEIDCDCGYSILLPDEASLNQTGSQNLGFLSPPIAMDEEDNEKIIEIHTSQTFVGTDHLSPDQVMAPFDGAVQLSDDAELPSEMPYDPDEAQALAQSKESWSSESANIGKFQDPLASEASLSAFEVESPNVVERTPEPSPAEKIIIQNQSISVGHFGGTLIHLDLSDLDESALLKLAVKYQEILKNNPWMESLLESLKLSFNPEKMSKEKKLCGIPEILALELFLYCHEIGSSCKLLPEESL